MSKEFWDFAKDFFKSDVTEGGYSVTKKTATTLGGTSPLLKKPCPKCGGGKLHIEYHGNVDRLKVTCQTCSHKWDAEPLDKKGGSP